MAARICLRTFLRRTILVWFYWHFWVGSNPGGFDDYHHGGWGVMAETRVEFHNAGDPTKENTVLSLYCKIWELARNGQQTVSIIRQLRNQVNQTEELTRNDDILMSETTDTSTNAFLAKRTLSDGSLVYLLSIMDVSRQDAGDYTCEIFARRGSNWVQLTAQVIPVEIQYLPGSQYPMCAPDTQPLPVTWGQKTIINCSSELSIPPVSLTWSRAGGNTVGDEDTSDDVWTSQSGGMIHSHLSIVPRSTDQDVVYICQSSSQAFWRYEGQQCYVGPLTVRDVPETTTTPVLSTPTNVPATVVTTTPNPMFTSPDTPPQEECIEEPEPCPLLSPEAMPWIAASVCGGIVAIMFFFIAIILYVQIKRLKTATKKRRKAIMEAVVGGKEGPYDLPYDTIQRARYADDENAYIAAIARARLQANMDAKTIRIVQGESHYADLPAHPPGPSNVSTISRPIEPPEPPSTPRKENLI